MGSKLKCGLLFLAGLASGAAGMFVFMRQKWQKDFEAKQEEMIRYYEHKGIAKEDDPGKKPEITKEEPPKETEEEKQEKLQEMKEVIMKNDYNKISTPERVKNDAPSLNDDYSDEPYEIDGRESGTQEMYGMLTLYLHEDGEIRTDKYELLDDDAIENYIGSKNLQKLADRRDEDPELEAFYVRNDRLHLDIDIEIVSGG